MSTYLSEQEQVQLIKSWLKKYGISIVVGVLLALSISYGYRYWQRYQTQKAEQASWVYEQLLAAQNNQQTVQTTQLATQLIKKNTNPYATLAALFIARQAVLDNQIVIAEKNLQWAIAHAHDKSLTTIAKLRLARVLLAQKKTPKALQLLNTIKANNFGAEVALLQGDAYLQLNDKIAARNAYQAALQQLPAYIAIRDWVKMKLDNLS